MSAAAAPAAAQAPTLVGQAPPPVPRDRMVATWVAAVSLSWFGDTLWAVALAWTAAHTLSPAMAGVVVGAELIPQAALVVVGGVLAHRCDTRRVLVLGRLAQGVVLLAGALAWVSGVRGADFLVALGVTLGVSAGLTVPSGATMARQLVAAEDLATVSGWNQIGNRVARLLVAPAGGAVVAWSGPAGAMVLDAVTFVVIAATLGLVVRPRFALPRSTGQPWLASVRDGVAYLLIGCSGVDARPVLLAAMEGVGVSAGAASVWLSGAYRRTVAVSHLGRVSSLSGLGDMALVPLAVPAFGALAASTSVLVAAAVCGLGMALLCAWFATRPRIAEVR